MEILHQGRTIATREFPYALWEYFPGSTRLIAGQKYKVVDVSVEQTGSRKHYRAAVEPVDEVFSPYVRAIKEESYEIIADTHEKTSRTGITLGWVAEETV